MIKNPVAGYTLFAVARDAVLTRVVPEHIAMCYQLAELVEAAPARLPPAIPARSVETSKADATVLRAAANVIHIDRVPAKTKTIPVGSSGSAGAQSIGKRCLHLRPGPDEVLFCSGHAGCTPSLKRSTRTDRYRTA